MSGIRAAFVERFGEDDAVADGDVDYLGLMVGVYADWMPAEVTR